jgi:hypothetical protein
MQFVSGVAKIEVSRRLDSRQPLPFIPLRGPPAGSEEAS